MFTMFIFLSGLLEGTDLYYCSSLYIGLFREVYNSEHIFTVLLNFTVSGKSILEGSLFSVCVRVCLSPGACDGRSSQTWSFPMLTCS